MLTEPTPLCRDGFHPLTGAPERQRPVYRVEARTPAGWMPAAEAATLLWAVAYVEAGDGLSRLVPEYRVRRGDVVMWTGRAGSGRAFGRPRRNEEE